MKKTRIFVKIVVCLLVLSTILTLAAGCKKEPATEKDPSIIYYVNTTDVPETGKQRIQFAKLKINN